TKPFGMRELLARIRAVLRRAESRAAAAAAGPKRAHYRFAGWEVSPRTRPLTSPAGEPTPPTKGGVNPPTALLPAPPRMRTRTRRLAPARRGPDAADQGRVQPADGLPRGAAADADARAVAHRQPPARPGGVRPQHRRADSAPAPQAGSRSQRSAADQDRAGRR